ncbi:MAG: Trk system potassium transporter TrkA [Oscillospiraceae bacterium]|nr:Trk system potassium transporter TrkA [Oscillospiraceae bacterium]
MDIIIAGTGKTGLTLARQLIAEGHDITLIDTNARVLESALERCDAMAVCGNCASKKILLEAGVKKADLLIAAADADEVNLLCCMTAHGVNKSIHTIARIRRPEYAEQVMTMPEIFPLSLTVNPEKRAAAEIERLLKYPGFLRRDTFAKGRVEIVELRIDEQSKLKDVSLSEMSGIVKCRVLVCAVLRNGEAVAPSGNFVLRSGDRIFVTAPTAHLTVLLKNLGIITRRVRKVLICGGGRVSFYLAKLLEDDNISVKILDRDYNRCVELAELLPGATVCRADCSSQQTLESQGIREVDAVACLTGMDETNIITALYADKLGMPQVITKISRGDNGFADTLPLGSVICPKELCSNDIVRYVRAMQNQTGAAISLHTIADGQVEAVEFLVDSSTRNRDLPLKKLKLRSNVLIASITHGANTEIPNGDSVFTEGDTVVVVTSGRGVLKQINDIFA